MDDAIFSDNHCLWGCPNAFSLQNKCVFVKCNQCYILSTERTARVSKAKHGEVCCNHSVLESFTDTTYYKKDNIAIYADDGNWPKQCVSCKKRFVS